MQNCSNLNYIFYASYSVICQLTLIYGHCKSSAYFSEQIFYTAGSLAIYTCDGTGQLATELTL